MQPQSLCMQHHFLSSILPSERTSLNVLLKAGLYMPSRGFLKFIETDFGLYRPPGCHLRHLHSCLGVRLRCSACRALGKKNHKALLWLGKKSHLHLLHPYGLTPLQELWLEIVLMTPTCHHSCSASALVSSIISPMLSLSGGPNATGGGGKP